MTTDLEPGAQRESQGDASLRVGLWIGAVVAPVNAALPWIETIEGVSPSSRSVSARFLVAAGLLVATLTIVLNSRLRAGLPTAPMLSIVIFSVVVLSTIAWSDLGPGTIGMGLVMLIPTLAKLSKRE